MSSAFQAHVASLVLSGIFEKLPNLRFAMIEGGFAWAPSLSWRLDQQWRRFEIGDAEGPPAPE